MKRTHNIILIFLLCGAIFGLFVVLIKPEPPPEPPFNTNQEDFLLLVVDKIGKGGSLITAWRIGYCDDYKSLSFTPLFPMAPGYPENYSIGVADDFSMDIHGAPSDKFKKRLEEEFTLPDWDGHIVVSKEGVVLLIDKMGGIELDGKQLGAIDFIGEHPDPTKGPAEVSNLYRAIISAFSDANLTKTGGEKGLEWLMGMTPTYIVSDISIETRLEVAAEYLSNRDVFRVVVGEVDK